MSETLSPSQIKCGPTCRHDDKAVFPAGPWQDEPDRLDFECAGFDCLLHRAPLGAWCGYVAVPPGHPLHRVKWDDERAYDLRVHGGLTYTDRCQGPVCHVAAPGQPDDVWWLGFDCSHASDLVPGMALIQPRNYGYSDDTKYFPYDIYRDLAYVREQTEALAEQLAALAASPMETK